MDTAKFRRVLSERRRATESFLRRGLWEEGRHSRVKPWIRSFLRFLILVGREFRRDDCVTRASALTYITLLALVPILVVMFAASRGLGLDEIEDSFIKNVLVRIQLDPMTESDAVQSVSTFIRKTVQRINFATLGVVGLLGLIFTAIMAVGSAEEAFNRIWGVERGRSVWRRFSDYLSVLMIGPLLIFLALTQSVEVARQIVSNTFGSVPIAAGISDLLLSQVWPMIVASLAFGFVYIFLPNTHVKIRCALLGGLLAGFLWQVSQWGYVNFQVGVAKYSALYGTLSALPIFLIWIYMSWVILLFGAEVTFCSQDYRRLSREFLDVNLSVKDRESIGVWMTAKVVESFVNGTSRWSLVRLSDALHLRDSVTRSVLAPLVDRGILATLAGEDGDIVPGRDPATLCVSNVLRAIHEAGDELSAKMTDDLFHRVVDRKDQLRKLGVESADLSFVEFLQSGRTPAESLSEHKNAADVSQ